MNAYERMARIIRYLEEHQTEQPSLETLAKTASLSPHHFHREFVSWTGVTPKDFLQCLTFQQARSTLQNGSNVLDASLDCGLSGPGRLHDLCVHLEGVSPGEIKSGGENVTILYGTAPTAFGHCLVGQSQRGMVHLSFSDEKLSAHETESLLGEDWPRANLTADQSRARATIETLFPSKTPNPKQGNKTHLWVRGTAFQVQVWQALLRIPEGHLVSYGQIARAIGQPQASRAVGTAVGSNPISYLIPCHRVIRSTGVLGEYRWGKGRKRALVAWELARGF